MTYPGQFGKRKKLLTGLKQLCSNDRNEIMALKYNYNFSELKDAMAMFSVWLQMLRNQVRCIHWLLLSVQRDLVELNLSSWCFCLKVFLPLPVPSSIAHLPSYKVFKCCQTEHIHSPKEWVDILPWDPTVIAEGKSLKPFLS